MKIWLWNTLLFIKLGQIVKKNKFNEIILKILSRAKHESATSFLLKSKEYT